MYRATSAVFSFMYLKKLYRQSKLWFVIVMLFAAGQLFINYKRGVEFSPFYHYNMFSLSSYFADNYKVTEVRVNGKLLQPENFTPNGWDNIVIPIVKYENQLYWNTLIYNSTVKRFLSIKDSSLYINHLSQQEFDKWYQQRIIRLLGLKDDNTSVQYQTATYHRLNDSLYQ